MLVIGDQRRRDAVMHQQRAGDAGVFGEHRIRRRQSRERAERHILEVADRGRHHVQARVERFRLCREAEGGEGRDGLGRIVDRPGAARPIVDSLSHEADIATGTRAGGMPAPGVSRHLLLSSRL